MRNNILVVEDDAAIQELIAVNLEHAGHQVARAGNALEAEASIRSVLPDLIVLDWMLPDLSGTMLARRLRADPRSKDVPIIMLTARCEERDKVEGLEAGADDYITKPFSPLELAARIKAVLRRRAPQLTEDTVEIGGLRLNPATHQVWGNGTELSMGPTEFKLLHYLMTHTERVHSRSRLLDQVWGDHVFVEERTVDVHIKRLRNALAPTGHDKLVRTVRGAGYRLHVEFRGERSMS